MQPNRRLTARHIPLTPISLPYGCSQCSLHEVTDQHKARYSSQKYFIHKKSPASWYECLHWACTDGWTGQKHNASNSPQDGWQRHKTALGCTVTVTRKVINTACCQKERTLKLATVALAGSCRMPGEARGATVPVLLVPACVPLPIHSSISMH